MKNEILASILAVTVVGTMIYYSVDQENKDRRTMLDDLHEEVLVTLGRGDAACELSAFETAMRHRNIWPDATQEQRNVAYDTAYTNCKDGEI